MPRITTFIFYTLLNIRSSLFTSNKMQIISIACIVNMKLQLFIKVRGKYNRQLFLMIKEFVN